MSELDSIASARLLIWLMKVCGIWNFQGKAWNKYYRLYGWMLHLIFTFLFILAMYIKIGLARNIDELSEALYMSLTETALLAKIVVVLTRAQSFVELFETFEHYADGEAQRAEEIAIATIAHRQFARLRNMHITGSIIVVSSASISALFDKSYNLPFPCWIPFEYHNEKNFHYAYSYVVGGIMVTAMANFTMDLVQSYFLFQLSIYYKLLGKRFELFGWHDNTQADQLARLFDFHATLSRLTGYCERLISWPVFVQIMMSAFVLCFSIYILQNLNFLKEPSEFVIYSVYILVMLLQIYIPCTYGNQLTESAFQLTNAVYGCNWVDSPLPIQKRIYVYMEYLKKPVVVRAGNFFVIGLGVFTQTINNSYRLYALLLNIKVKT